MSATNAIRSLAQYLTDNTDAPIHVKLNSEYNAGGQVLDVEAVNVNLASYDKAGAAAVTGWREIRLDIHIVSASADTAAEWADELIAALNAGRAALCELVEGEMVPLPNKYLSWEPTEATDFSTETTSTHAYWAASFDIRYKL